MATTETGRPNKKHTRVIDLIRRVAATRTGWLAYLPFFVAAPILLSAALVEALFVNVDVLEYQCYATVFWFGAETSALLKAPQCRFILPFSQFHTLPLEYPPLTLAVFSPPLIAPERVYPLMFGMLMALTALFVYWLLLRYGPGGGAMIFAAAMLAGCIGTAFSRFDLAPAALTLLSVILAERRHWSLAYLALALGVLTKMYPVVLFPIFFLAEQREQTGFYRPDGPVTLKTLPTVLRGTLRSIRALRWGHTLEFLGVLVGVTGFFWVLNHAGAFGSFSYLYLRPFEIESLGSSLLWVASHFGAPIHSMTSFGSLDVSSPLGAVVSQGFFILMCLGYIYIILQQWEGKMDLVQAGVAALLVVMSASKVFSPQYLLWIIPLLAYGAAHNRRLLLYWLGISALTTMVYPIYFGILSYTIDPFQTVGFMPAILLRNVLFATLTAMYLLNLLNLRERSPLPQVTQAGKAMPARQNKQPDAPGVE